MKKLYLSAYTICTVCCAYAQQTVLWQRDIKSSTQDFLSQITPTLDGQYLITGSSIQAKSKEQGTNGQQNRGYDLHLIKLNQQGDQVWEKYFSGNAHDYIASTVATEDGGFLVSGTSRSGKNGDKKDDSKGSGDIWLIRINSFGDELWQKTLGTSADEEARAVIQTTDLGFFVAGDVQNAGNGSKDAWIIRLDKNGKELSQLILRGDGLDEVEKMIPTKDGGALVGMYSRGSGVVSVQRKMSNVKSIEPAQTSVAIREIPLSGSNEGEGDYRIIKIDKNGKFEWEKNFGGTGDDHLRTLALTSEGYLIGGESRSERSGNKTVGIEEGTDLWLIAVNIRGEDLWQKSYNFKNRDILMGMSVLHSADDKTSKGIILGGYTQSEGRIEKDDEKFWMLYIDQEGKEKWRKYVKGESSKKEERLSDIKLNRDGSIVVAGTSADKLGQENWKIVKLGDKQIDQLIEKQDVKIYPNPVSDYTYAEIGFEFKEAQIMLYDMSGKLIQTLNTKNKVTKINTQNLIQGAYLVSVKTDSNKTADAKLIKK